jgi:hypothetical protein
MRRPTVFHVLALALPTVLLFACGGTDDAGGGGDSTDDAVSDPDTDPGDPDTDLGDDSVDDASGTHLAGTDALEPRVQEAIAQLVDDGVERDAIALVLAEPVVWSDGSIGCPEPGMMYTQALVEGYRIVLEVDGEEVAFHGAGFEPPFRCDGPVEPASGGNPAS